MLQIDKKRVQKLYTKVYDLIDGSGFLNLSIVKIHCF